MSETFSADLTWLADFRRLFGGKVDLVLEPRPADADSPACDYGSQLPQPRTILLNDERDARGDWLSQVAAALHSTEWNVCLANVVAIPSGSLDNSSEDGRFLDGAAFLAEVLKKTKAGKVIIALSPTALLLSEQAGPFRAWLAKAHRVEVIIYTGSPSAQLSGVNPRLGIVLLVISSGTVEGGAQRVLRMVNLGESAR
jgi:hypothetical protein